MTYFVNDNARRNTPYWMPQALPEASDFKNEPTTEPVRKAPVDTSFMSLDDLREYFPERSQRFSDAVAGTFDDVTGPQPKKVAGGWADANLLD